MDWIDTPNNTLQCRLSKYDLSRHPCICRYNLCIVAMSRNKIYSARRLVNSFWQKNFQNNFQIC
jgi:hypothetical protein